MKERIKAIVDKTQTVSVIIGVLYCIVGAVYEIIGPRLFNKLMSFIGVSNELKLFWIVGAIIISIQILTYLIQSHLCDD